MKVISIINYAKGRIWKCRPTVRSLKSDTIDMGRVFIRIGLYQIKKVMKNAAAELNR